LTEHQQNNITIATLSTNQTISSRKYKTQKTIQQGQATFWGWICLFLGNIWQAVITV